MGAEQKRCLVRPRCQYRQDDRKLLDLARNFSGNVLRLDRELMCRLDTRKPGLDAEM
jgi:hypothetical protein